MTCEWRDKLDLYVDAELPDEERSALEAHLHNCTTCAAAALDRMQFKRTVQVAGLRYTPRPEFRAQVRQAIAPPAQAPKRIWRWIPALALGIALVAVVLTAFWQVHSSDARARAELVDLHITTLASANPVDVVSSDMHTVKPWFAGKLPFTFNLPELKDTPFTLIGGRVVYFQKNPGAQLLFGVRRHRISVFIFNDTAQTSRLASSLSNTSERSFDVTTWEEGSLRFFAISDVNPTDLNTLRQLFESAGRQ